MEGDLQRSPQLEFSIDDDDAKYFSGLSTILVATIQEVKDRISQIEYLFCSQLFPNFHSMSKSLQKRLAEVRRVAEDDWKKKERSLLHEIEELRLEKQHAQEQNRCLVASLEQEKAKLLTKEQLLKTHQTEETLLRAKLESIENGEVAVLQEKLMQKTEEVAKGKELQEKLLQQIASKNNELLVAEDKRSDAIARYTDITNSLHKSVAEARKVAEDDWKKKERSLLHQIEELRLEKQRAQEQNHCLITYLELEKSKLLTNEQLLNIHETEKKLLLAKLDSLENGEFAVLQEQLMHKTEEAAKGKELQEKLQQQIESKNHELLVAENNRSDAIARFMEIKKSYKYLKSQYSFLLSRTGLASDSKILTNRMDEEWDTSRIHRNQRSLLDSKSEGPNSMLNTTKPSEQANKIGIQAKPKNGCDGLIPISNSYSNIKIPSTSTSLHAMKPTIKVKSESSTGLKRSISSWIDTQSHQEAGGADPHHDFLDTPIENVKENLKKAPRIAVQDFPVPAPKHMEFDNSDDETQEINVDPAAQKRHLSISMKPTIKVKTESSTGLKRTISSWIDTRSHQEAGGADPHDDFLDTPIENVKENLKKAPRIAVQDFPVPAPKDMEFDNSDDETQEINADPAAAQKQHLSISRPENRGFKYVEPVRKKAERENLKGVECKQCKKFYDAVIPDGGDNSNYNNIRCEHHDGVSRHRYRYVPPMTPEGFWNIGFDSDL